MVGRQLAWVALGLVSCTGSSPSTELLVVSDTDLLGQLDRIEFEVVDPRGTRMEERRGSVRDEEDLPQTLALVHDSGSLGPIDITVRAMWDSTLLVERRARVSFVEGQTLVVPLHLSSTCVGVTCEGATSCGPPATCEPLAWTAAQLAPYTDMLPRLEPPVPSMDGGSVPEDAGDGSVRSPDAANPTDASTPLDSGEAGPTCGTDMSIDTQTDPQHCGGCNSPCPAPESNGRATCVGGVCEVECSEGWGTCGLADPCTTSLNTPVNCGRCGKACAPPFCSQGVCVSG